MSELNNYEDVMVEETGLDEIESGGKDLSTAIGVALIGGSAVVVYEGGKRVVKFVAPKVKNGFNKLFKRKKDGDQPEQPVQNEPAAEAPQSTETK